MKKMRRTISMLLTVVMIITMLPVQSFAADVTTVAEGTCGEDLTWVLDSTGLLSISGTGDMDDYTSTSMPWYQHSGSITSLKLNEGITRIGNHAFYSCSRITGDLVIPNSVSAIGTYAFSGCSGFNGTLTL